MEPERKQGESRLWIQGSEASHQDGSKMSRTSSLCDP